MSESFFDEEWASIVTASLVLVSSLQAVRAVVGFRPSACRYGRSMASGRINRTEWAWSESMAIAPFHVASSSSTPTMPNPVVRSMASPRYLRYLHH